MNKQNKWPYTFIDLQETYSSFIISFVAGTTISYWWIPHTRLANNPSPFLVVKTNVGYSVIAEFIVQHEDTESISEALGHLQWHWSRCGITVNDLMIDYQKSEENTICNVLLQLEVYICDFHCLQCWDQHLRIAKNGLMKYREQSMALLCTVADSCSLDECIDKKHKLMSSYVWNKDHKLSDYYRWCWEHNEEVQLYN